jgi:hypothetical protein
MSQGFDDVLVKPFSREALRAVLLKHCVWRNRESLKHLSS